MIGDDKLKALMREFGVLSTQRTALKDVWQKAYEFADPANAFITKDYNPKELVKAKLYSTAAKRCLPKFVSALHWTITPQTQKWHTLGAPTEEMNKKPEIRLFYDKLTATLFEERYKMDAGFNKAMFRIYKNFGIVGLGPVMVDDYIGHGLRYEAVSPKSFLYRLDSRRRVSKAWRVIKMPFDELADFLRSNSVPLDVLPKAVCENGERNPAFAVELTHVVFKLSEDESRACSVITADGRVALKYRFWQMYVIRDAEGTDPFKIILQNGLSSCPYVCPRYQEQEDSDDTTSPTIDALTDLNLLNRMRKSGISGAEKASDPPLLAMDDGDLDSSMPRAGAIISGGVTSDGKAAIQALDVVGNINVGFELEDKIQAEIEEYYLKPVFMMYYQKNDMTATEVEQLSTERNMLMSIYSCPMEDELLYPMVERELDILYRQGKFPETIPDEIAELIERGDLFFSIQYEGGAKKALERQKAAGIMETAQAVNTIAAFYPQAKNVIKWRDAIQQVATANGVSQDFIRTDEEFKTALEEEQEAALEQARAQSGYQAGVGDDALTSSDRLMQGRF